LTQWGQDRTDDFLYGSDIGPKVGLGSLAVGLGGGALYAQYELTGETKLDSLGLIPKISLGNGAKLSIDPSLTLVDPSLTLDGGLWTGDLNLEIKDWSPFPNPAVTVALSLDTTWDSDGGYTIDSSGKVNWKLSKDWTLSGVCEFKNGSKSTSWGTGFQFNYKH
jgi:hypothetical protein